MTDKRDLLSAINSLRRGRREDRNSGDEAGGGSENDSDDLRELESQGVSPESARVSLLAQPDWLIPNRVISVLNFVLCLFTIFPSSLSFP